MNSYIKVLIEQDKKDLVYKKAKKLKFFDTAKRVSMSAYIRSLIERDLKED